MKIKVECTLEVDPKVIKQLMQARGVFHSDETIQYFVRSHVISAGGGVLDDALYDADLEEGIDIIKTNIL
jgi:phosphotransferase system IIB component